MAFIENWITAIRTRTVAFLAIVLAVAITAVSCAGGTPEATAPVGIDPSMVAEYIHTVLNADRTAYTKHVVSRVQTLEGKTNDAGVLDVEATEGWQQTDGIPLPAQMFRLGSEIANESGFFTYNLISEWYLNDNHAPKGEFEETALAKMTETGEAVKDYQEIGGQRYYSAMYPDLAVVESCATCHNTHPVHLERYPDKVFEVGDVMGGVVINIPMDNA